MSVSWGSSFSGKSSFQNLCMMFFLFVILICCRRPLLSLCHPRNLGLMGLQGLSYWLSCYAVRFILKSLCLKRRGLWIKSGLLRWFLITILLSPDVAEMLSPTRLFPVALSPCFVDAVASLDSRRSSTSPFSSSVALVSTEGV